MDEQQICLSQELMPEETETLAEPEEEASVCQDADGKAEEKDVELLEAVDVLRARIRELEEALSQREALADRMTRECEEFEAYFPEVPLRGLPDEVWTRVHAGVPLAAAYALYERGLRNRSLAAQEQNERNAKSLPDAPAPAQSHYFSPAQVRAMSRREVRENYDRIFESMRHWQ